MHNRRQSLAGSSFEHPIVIDDDDFAVNRLPTGWHDAGSQENPIDLCTASEEQWLVDSPMHSSPQNTTALFTPKVRSPITSPPPARAGRKRSFTPICEVEDEETTKLDEAQLQRLLDVTYEDYVSNIVTPTKLKKDEMQIEATPSGYYNLMNESLPSDISFKNTP